MGIGDRDFTLQNICVDFRRHAYTFLRMNFKDTNAFFYLRISKFVEAGDMVRQDEYRIGSAIERKKWRLRI